MAVATLPAAAQMTEGELLDSVIELSHLFGWTVAHFRPAMTQHGWRTPVSAGGKGFPDLVLVRDRLLFVELKSQRGTLTIEQQEWLLALEKAGANIAIWRPEQWVDGSIEKALREQTP